MSTPPANRPNVPSPQIGDKIIPHHISLLARRSVPKAFVAEVVAKVGKAQWFVYDAEGEGYVVKWEGDELVEVMWA